MSDAMRWGDLVVSGDARRRAIRERHGNGVDGVEVREGGHRLVVYFLEHAPHGLHAGNVRIDAPPGARTVSVVEVRRAAELDRELEDRLIVELDRPGSVGVYRLQIVQARPDGSPGRRPHRGIDPRFAGAGFVFDIDAPRLPIRSEPHGAAPGSDETVTYLSRDYAGLRQLMLDRLAVTLPGWSERHEPDIWITLVELLAYVGDDLSYYEDAVATEAYLQTARQRISVRRHARLVDYRLHEGCNARAWVCLDVAEPTTLPLHAVRFAAAGDEVPSGSPVLDASSVPEQTLAAMAQYTPLSARPGAPQPAPAVQLLPAHGAIGLWSWGERDSHLLAGATSAVLQDGQPTQSHRRSPRRDLQLRVGDVLVLEEIHDPQTKGLGPADPTHRQAVRLTDVRRTFDQLYDQPLVEVEWAGEDALTFDLAVTADGVACGQATGNVVLVAHGVVEHDAPDPDAPALTRAGLGFSSPFPDPDAVARHQARRLRSLYAAWRREIEHWLQDALRGTPLSDSRLKTLTAQIGSRELERLRLAGEHRRDDRDDREERAERDVRGLEELLARADVLLSSRRRRLESLARLAEAHGPLHDVLIAELDEDWGKALSEGLSAAHPGSWGPAATATVQDPRAALPLLELTTGPGQTWQPASDLIGAGPGTRAFVAEIDDQGIAHLRLNPPAPAAPPAAAYWIGNGVAGNAEVGAINALVWVASGSSTPGPAGPAPPAGILAVRNPIAAIGGVDPEPIASAKLAVPGAFLSNQERALTADDYAALAAGVPGARRAAAELRFTGSLTVAEVAVQPAAGEEPSDELLGRVRRALEPVRRIGHLVRVIAPQFRAMVVTLHVTLAPDTLRREVAKRLARLMSSGWQVDGTPGLFNPESLAFATPVHASPIVAAVHAVPGIKSVSLTGFGFLDQPAGWAPTAVAAELTLGTLEIARLDNDPTKPEHGYALVTLTGGR